MVWLAIGRKGARAVRSVKPPLGCRGQTVDGTAVPASAWSNVTSSKKGVGVGGFVEYREIGSSDPLRQGDVLESVDESATKWKRNLLVITADCDFANAKNQGRVTCVPLLSAEEYLAEMQFPRIRERLVKKPLDSLQAAVITSPHPDVSRSRLREWVSEEDAVTIVSQLGVDLTQKDIALRAIASIRLLDMLPESFDEAVQALIECQLVGPAPPKRENARRNVMQALCETYTQPPGDALFLSSIGPAHEDGYFAYLRHLEQVWQGDISIRPLHRSAQYRRIARLQDRFTHAVVQRFGMVFMSIGLPKEYEEIRNLHSEILGDRF